MIAYRCLHRGYYRLEVAHAVKYRYEYPRPGLTVDVAVVRGGEADREILLVERAREPFAGAWALPGGFVEPEEPLEDAARRELVEETGLDLDIPMAQVGAYGDPGRDPRGWTVSVLFLAHTAVQDARPLKAGDDAGDAAWFPVWDLPVLAFDHERLVADALRHARRSERHATP